MEKAFEYVLWMNRRRQEELTIIRNLPHARCFTEEHSSAVSSNCFMCVHSHSVMSDSLQFHGLFHGHGLPRFPCPWNFPGKNTRVVCHLLLRSIFRTQELNLYLFVFPLLAGRFFITVPPGKMFVFKIALTIF